MSRKLYLLLLISLVTVNAANAGVADQNARLKLLIERAKARKAGEAVPAGSSSTTTTTTTTTTSTPVQQPIIINRSPVTPVVPIPTTPAPAPQVVVPAPPSVPTTTTPTAKERKPKVLETHPKHAVEPVKEAAPITQPQAPTAPVFQEKVIINEKTIPEQPVKIKVVPAIPATTTTIIEKKTSVVQPPIQTLITPALSPIQTRATTQTTIESIQNKPGVPVQKPSIENVQGKSIDSIQTQTEFKAEPNAGNSNYNDVLNSIDAILQGQQAEEKANQKSKGKTPELDAKPVTKKDDRKATEALKKETSAEIKAPTKADPKADAAASSPKDLTDKTTATETASATTDKDADYLLVMRKSLKSLEEDSWANVKLNMGEALDYFAKEKKLYPNNPKLNTYYKVILGFQRFSEGGLELDEGDFADFEDAEALYLDTQDLLEEAKKELGKDYSGEQVRGVVDTVLKYTEEELQYIEEMLGM